ncbi:MAG: cadherin-like beta sandwich domain-containing protein [Clostridia bacterium]|nr:cadherin-like beta sandwich domain-containing protein [Clostridia bacterium]MBQ7289246.1 cadherin-like beta sandwich domain-containing protein [Clostridia bacterium]
MKKTVTLFVAVILILSFVIAVPLPASAAGASISFSKSTLRSGDSFTVTLNVALNNAITVDGTFSHSSNLVLNSISGSVGTLDVQGKTIFVDLGNTGVSGSKAVVTANFTVSGSAQVGETLSVSFSGSYSNLSGDTTISGAGSKTVAAPLSTNCNLKSLTVSNATLSPAFSTGTTSYSAGTVEYSVSKLNINAVAEDAKAKVSISGNSLAVGDNTVRVVVKAENGATKTYTIKVTRKQDPNYVPSSNTALSGISVDGFLISPPFQNGVERYVVWLPYETTAITARATAADAKASVSVSGGQDLVAGSDNTVTITCTAEDGSQKSYYVIAKRAAQDGSEIKSEEVPEDAATEKVDNTDNTSRGLGVLPVIALCIFALLIGALVMFVLIRFGVIRFKA